MVIILLGVRFRIRTGRDHPHQFVLLAAVKRCRINFRDRSRNRDARQGSAIPESTEINGGHRIRNHDFFQRNAAVEEVIADRFHVLPRWSSRCLESQFQADHSNV